MESRSEYSNREEQGTKNNEQRTMNFQHSITPARSLFDLKLQEIWRYRNQHTANYQSIINGKGYGLQDALHSVKIVKQVRYTLIDRETS